MKLRYRTCMLILMIFVVIVSLFVNHSYNNFKLYEEFSSIPLSFDPVSCKSEYDWNGSSISIKGGFVKGKINTKSKNESILLRSISPTPIITIKGDPNQDKKYNIRLENVDPKNIIVKNIEYSAIKEVEPHTILLVINLKKNQSRTIEILPKEDADYFEFVILGDNRNGYNTFSQAIGQINAVKPVFVIDNGDLVFAGDPNRYRLFYETISNLQIPIYTTLGNHDIRKGGRTIYTQLFGPPYYSFTYRNIYFIFLDSSRGWTDKQAIPDEQYEWLENELKKAMGKRIFVISHIPSTDPRASKTINKFPEIPGIERTEFFERLMDNYNQFKELNHGFPDPNEAEKFESLMSRYEVDTVFVSHIHSYFSYIKDNVRYIISGGGGAELLTKNSYYHYLRLKVTEQNNYVEMVQLPSPKNTLHDRYIAAAILYARSIYKEYKRVVVLIFLLFIVLLFWILYSTYNRWWPAIMSTGKWISIVFTFARKEYKKMKRARQ